ncbi:uncharacterized protein EHS24_003253 [Apiotrichum porosum]|uniref:Uncharacterized protein n=1 Tax=Apiotrichum porosum TaxID=105984 RepID=A0A427XFZ1_9TREE|nr:uncharacterized protein EHS24_003253 [Apiotrichum porosum]RSH77687.1 hypothetical protein EHS24_003253 [Apiotrichum porosum]
MVTETYYWTPQSDLSIDEYLKKCKPSVVTNADTAVSIDLWMLVDISGSTSAFPRKKTRVVPAAMHSRLLKRRALSDMTKRYLAVEANDEIPVRAKKGVKSKKAVRDEIHVEAAEAIKGIAQETKYVHGKWVLFANENVDSAWGKIARSIAFGPLKDVGVTAAKVAPKNLYEPDRGHVICIYFKDVYDKDLARRILVVLLKDHGLNPTGVKSDLYTLLDLDSQHPSKIRTTVWRPNEVIDGGAAAVKALQDEYSPSKEAARNKKAAAAAAAGDLDKDTAADGTDDSNGEIKPESEAKVGEKRQNADENEKVVKRPKTAATKYKENDMFAASDSEDE